MQIHTVGVLGCGLMGSGIAQVAAQAGYRTIVREVDDAALQTGLDRIRRFLDEGVARGKVTPEHRSQDVSLLFAALAIAIHSAAYQAEIFRAGLQSVPRGQLEAAQAIGLGRWQTMKAILLPQALRLSLPPLATEFATLVKDTSLLGALGASELFALVSDFNQLVARGLIGEFSWVFATWTVAALMYFLLTFAITRVFRFVETWVRVPGMEGVSA